MKKVNGFSLVELMIVLVIVAILAGLAIPAYSNYVYQARRSDAKVALTQAATKQERYFMRNNRYSGDVDDIGGNGSNVFNSSEGYYAITSVVTGCDDGDGTCFTLTATAISTESQWRDTDCRSFSITDSGRKSALDAEGAENAACW